MGQFKLPGISITNYKKAYEEAFENDFYGTDDSMLVESIGRSNNDNGIL